VGDKIVIRASGSCQDCWLCCCASPSPGFSSLRRVVCRRYIDTSSARHIYCATHWVGTTRAFSPSTPVLNAPLSTLGVH